MASLNQLRAANKRRQAEWPGAEAVDIAFRGLELAGETGELGDALIDFVGLSTATGRLSNMLKKVARLRRGIAGTVETPETLMQAIKDEAGDVLICLDLICMDLNFSLDDATCAKFNKTSVKHGLTTRLYDDGFDELEDD